MPDGWEHFHGLDPLDAADAEDDPDEDSLPNYLEYHAGTSPTNFDTDGDGMPDGWEYLHGLDPLNAADAWDDIDADGLNNRGEYIHAANPRNPDHDGDGLADGIDPQPNSWHNADADNDGDGYPLWQELFYGTSDAVYGDVAQILTNGSHTVTFTTSGAYWGVLKIGDHPIPLGWRQEFSLDLPSGTSIPIALTNSCNHSVSITSTNCLVLTESSGSFASGGTGNGTATLVLPVVTIGSGGTVCLHEADQMITASVTPPLPGTYDWIWDGGGLFGTGHAIMSTGIPPGGITVRFRPAGGNGAYCEHTTELYQCHRTYCPHGRPARQCLACTDGGSAEWCLEHDMWKCTCPCISMGGYAGILAPGTATSSGIGNAYDSCVHQHYHTYQCCPCPEHHIGGSWYAEEKTNIVHEVSRLDVYSSSGGTPVVPGSRFTRPAHVTVAGAQLSERFGDARIVASHLPHPSHTATSSWTVAAIGLDAAGYAGGHYRIRGGTNCVSHVWVITESHLQEGSLLLATESDALRFSDVKDTPWSDAQSSRMVAPPVSLAGVRDLWLGTSRGGCYRLDYYLNGTVDYGGLSTNMHIEAIVARLETNAYYTAYGSTEDILVNLDPISHDSAGYTLSLDGTSIAAGQPPWLVSVGNLTAGAHTLTVQSRTFPDLLDGAALNVVRVDYLKASSNKAANSPQQFPGHQEWPFVPTNWSNPGRHLVVFFKDVVDANLNVLDFDIDLTAHLLPAGLSHTVLEESWRMISGPASGFLNRLDSFAVKFRNPRQGGVYKIGFDLGLDGLPESEANVVLPLAGAEIDSIIRADITRADAFATKVLAMYSVWERNRPSNGVEWFVTLGHGDYLGRPNNASAPTVRKYNQVDNDGMGAVATWCGVPVKVAKASNFMVAYACRRIGVHPALAWASQLIGTKNDSSAKKSWDAGWAVGGGAAYGTTVSNLVVDIWDEHKNDDRNQKLWPNHAPCDNYVAPQFFFGEQDERFTSPTFLYMPIP